MTAIPLCGTACAVCGYPANHLVIGPIGREVVHGKPGKRKVRRCPLPNPPIPTIHIGDSK